MIVFLHLVSMCAAVVLIFLADKQAFGWVLGKKQTLEAASVHRLHVLTWVALLCLIGSGAFLLFTKDMYLLREPLFVIKLLFVGILVVNAVLIGRLIPIALTRTFASLTLKEKMPLITSGLISGGSWVAILVIAFVLFWPWIS